MTQRPIKPILLPSRLRGVADCQCAVEHDDARVSALKLVDQVGIDSRGAVTGELEERAIEYRSHVEVFMISHAGHERHAIEDSGSAQKEMVPVGAFVASVDQIACE